jgi:hypothetical protein
MRPVKCYYCSNLIDRTKEEFGQLSSGRYTHKECFDENQQATTDRQKLLAYIDELFGKRVNFGVVTKQIKNYIDNYNYSYSGIHGTLYYCYAIKKQEINKAEGIGLVPYYYNEARRYWLQVNNAKNQDLTFRIDKRKVTITSPLRNPLIRSKPLTLEELEAELNGENI